MQSYERTYGSETSGTQPSHCKREASAVSGSVVGDICPGCPPRQPHALVLAVMASAENKSAEPRMLLTRAEKKLESGREHTAERQTRI